MSRAWKALGVAALIAPVVFYLVRGADAGDAQRGTVVRYMAWGYPSHLATDMELIRLFESMPENSDVRVEFVMAPMRSYFDKLQMMLVSGTAPDVFRINPTYYYSFIRKGFLQELDPLMAADPEWNLDDFFELATVQPLYHGKRYALTVIFGTNLIYYNKTMFKEAGVRDPWQLYEAGEWTWDTFLDTARKLTRFDEKGRAVQYGTNFGPTTTNGKGAVGAVTFVAAGFGGKLISEDYKKSMVGSPEAVRAAEWVKDLVWKYRAAPTPQETAMATLTFESGRVAMEFDASGESRRMRDAITKFEWDVAPTPVGVEGRSAGHGGHFLVMNSDTKVRDAAWRFMKFMVSPECERLLGSKLRRCIPTRKAVALSDEYLAADGPPYNTRAFITQLELAATQYPYDERYNEWVVEYGNALDRIFYGGEPAGPVLKEAETKINEILAREEE